MATGIGELSRRSLRVREACCRRGNERVFFFSFFLFLDRVCIFIRCDESAATVLELGRYSIKLGRVRVDFVDLSRFFRMTSNVNIYGGGFRFFFLKVSYFLCVKDNGDLEGDFGEMEFCQVSCDFIIICFIFLSF